MLKEKQMQEIHDLKLRGYSINEIVKYYEVQSQKPPSLPTIRKYYQMDTVPEVPNQNLIKDRAFDHEPYRSAIIEIIRNNNKSSYCVSSIYDVLIEKFIEIGAAVSLPGNEQIRISVASGHPFRLHPDSITEISGHRFGNIRTPCQTNNKIAIL